MQKLLTPEEVAEYLGVKVSTIYQWTHQEFIQHVKLGRFVKSSTRRWENGLSVNESVKNG